MDNTKTLIDDDLKTKSIFKIINDELVKDAIINIKDKKLIIGVVAVFAVSACVAFTVFHNKKSTVNNNDLDSVMVHTSDVNAPKTNEFKIQLSDISSQLSSIEGSLSNKHAYVDLDKVRKSVVGLQTQVKSLADHSNELITQQIKSSTSQLQTELVSIKKQLAVLTAKKSHHKMLNSSALPFSVMSIDNIQESNVVTINYGHRFIPLDVGDNIAGWELSSASSVNQKAQFRNSKNEYVFIGMNQLSHEFKDS